VPIFTSLLNNNSFSHKQLVLVTSPVSTGLIFFIGIEGIFGISGICNRGA